MCQIQVHRAQRSGKTGVIRQRHAVLSGQIVFGELQPRALAFLPEGVIAAELKAAPNAAAAVSLAESRRHKRAQRLIRRVEDGGKRDPE